MPVIFARDSLEEYRARALDGDIHEMTGRGPRRNSTRFVCECILDQVQVPAGATFVDVGCGDGTLIGMVLARGAADITAIGILPTAEEVARLRDHFAATGVPAEVRQGLSEKVNLPDACADVVVCHSVLLIVGRTLDQIRPSLAELARLARPGATVWIGEIPGVDEADATRRSDAPAQGETLSAWLRDVWRKEGPRRALRVLDRIIRARISGRRLIVGPKQPFFCPPEDFAAELPRHGLQPVAVIRHVSMNRKGVQYDSTRWNYLCRRV